MEPRNRFQGMNSSSKQCLVSSELLAPHPLSTQRVCPPPAPKAEGTHSLAGRWGGGGSIFWKTQDIGLASYIIIPLRVRPSACQCQSRYSPRFDPSNLGHSWTWLAADEAVLNNVQKKILQMTGARRPKNTKTSSLHISLRDDVLGKICFFCTQILHFSEICLKVHKREKFFSSDFEFFTILYLVKLKY